jgi:hypothetical protein
VTTIQKISVIQSCITSFCHLSYFSSSHNLTACGCLYHKAVNNV